MRAQDFQLGLRDSRIVHVSQVRSGLQCNCYCPVCGGRLVAYKGEILRPHFKHHVEVNCRYSFETSLHYLAKEIIQQKQYLDLPVIDWEIPHLPSSWFHRSQLPESTERLKRNVTFQKVHFDKVEVEKWEGNFKPDLKCYVGDKELLVEITVTHGIDALKLEKIRNRDVPLLEINLSLHEHTISKKILINALYSKNQPLDQRLRKFRWIHNPKNDKLYCQQHQKSDTIFHFLKEHRKLIKLYGRNNEVYACPLMEKSKGPCKYADSCEFCFYNLGKTELPAKSDKLSNGQNRAVMCIGHKKYELELLFQQCGVKTYFQL